MYLSFPMCLSFLWLPKLELSEAPAYYFDPQYIIWAEDVGDRRNSLPDRIINFNQFTPNEQMLTWVVDDSGELRSIPCR